MDTHNEQPELPLQNEQERAAKKSVFFYAAMLAGGIVGFVIIAARIGYWYVSVQVRKPTMFLEKHVFTVEKGESVQTIAEDLEKKGLVSRGFFFWFYVWQHDLARLLQAGTYAVEGNVSAQSIADMIARGTVVRDTISVTVPEGFTMRDIDVRVREAGLLKNEKKHFVDLVVADFASRYDFLQNVPARAGLEGYLFPDTYEFKKDASLNVVAETMLDNFEKKAANGAVRGEIARQRKTMHEIVIMASIIEKEVMTPADMKLVSGVLWQRIALGMPLQVDASIIYATGRSTIVRDDLAIDSLYNTYKYKGLPNGPIANPGMNAIMAAIYPTMSDYLYYISKPNKETVFSKTLQEHNVAVQKYLK